METPNFLESYKVHQKPEAKKAAERKETREGESGIISDSSKRIEAYMERLENIFLHENLKTRDRNISLLKPSLYENTLIKKENFPENYFKFQKQQAKDRGLGEVSFTEDQKEEEITKVIESQRLSLDAWIDYLTGQDCKYPTDVKYFAMQGVLGLGGFDTEKYSFSRRAKNTTAPFAEIDREVLSRVLGAVNARHHGKDISNYSSNILSFIDAKRSFGDIYAETMRELDQNIDEENLLPITDGEWRTFEKGSDPQELVDALEGKRSNLCIADIGAATRYLEAGRIEVYFSNNEANRPIVPRIALAVSEDAGVYEIRGTYNKSEDIDPIMSETDILSSRIKNIPNGEKFLQQDASMKQLTDIYNRCVKIDKTTGEKIELNPNLSKDDLVFLYEINAPIEGFGYEKDPRIAELRAMRNPEHDMPVVFGCAAEQIARNTNQITENTKAYVGKLETGIFQKLPENLEHIYTSFPDRRIKIENLEDVESKTGEQWITELEQSGIHISDYAKSMLKNQDFAEGKNTENSTLVRLTVADLGFTGNATTDQIYSFAEQFGLELCPAEVGPQYRLKYQNQPMNEWLRIAMKQINDSDGHPNVFYMVRDGDGLWLNNYWAKPGYEWYPDNEFVFRLRKYKA